VVVGSIDIGFNDEQSGRTEMRIDRMREVYPGFPDEVPTGTSLVFANRI
jgi:hypothetical protein